MPLDTYVVKIFKSFGGRVTDNNWTNVYHVASDVPVKDPLWNPFVTALASAERQLHGTQVNLMRCVISTVGQEKPYDPASLRVWELAGIGERSAPAGESYLPLDLVLKCKKVVGYGRAGTCFFRGVLHTADATMGAGGKFAFLPTVAENLNNITNNVVSMTAASLEAMNGFMIMPPKLGDTTAPTQESVRIVQNIFASGISTNRQDHRYFDTAKSDDGVGVGT